MKLIFFVYLMLVWLTSCKHENGNDANSTDNLMSDAVRVRLDTVRYQVHESIISSTGILFSENEAKPSFKVGGIIKKLYVKEGARVRKGQLLAEIDLTEIAATARQVEEAYSKAARDFGRVENLFKDSVVTLEQFQNSKTAFEMAKQSRDIVLFNKKYSLIHAPIAGTIIKQILNIGELAAPGMPVYYMIGTQNPDWKIRAPLNDRDWAHITSGDRASIEFDSYPNQMLQSSVFRITDMAHPQSGTFDAEIRIPKTHLKLASGLIAQIRLYPSGRDSFLTVPIESMMKSNGKKAIVYVYENGKAMSREIFIYEMRGDKVVVAKGLQENEVIITAGNSYLEHGDTVLIEK
ncbi:MAG: efflux RND transporter periplasmic adaptor subunit [Bacteroidota bacterium]|nr:efflux RND transporter periplasmic adaptor subunit [Bacteroidota bacterium]